VAEHGPCFRKGDGGVVEAAEEADIDVHIPPMPFFKTSTTA